MAEENEEKLIPGDVAGVQDSTLEEPKATGPELKILGSYSFEDNTWSNTKNDELEGDLSDYFSEAPGVFSKDEMKDIDAELFSTVNKIDGKTTSDLKKEQDAVGITTKKELKYKTK